VKKILALLVVAGMVGLFVGCSTTSAPDKPKTDTPKPEEKTVTGKVVSNEKDKLVVKVDDKDVDFDVKGVEGADKFKKDDEVKVTTKDKKVTKVEKK